MAWFEDLMAEINSISDELRAVNEMLDEREDKRIQRTIEELREEYERGEIATAQSISAQQAMGNYKAGM